MNPDDRRKRLQKVKALGRIAFRLARSGRIEGFIEESGRRLRVRKLQARDFAITHYEAASPEASEDDASELLVEHAGSRVLEIRWTPAGSFRVIHFDGGEWEDELQAEATGCAPFD